ncbi:DNA-3-methyladenine glycosylase family protein [Nannocystis pusilla]|uniref:DNA-3-methyladenine glycosylase family protein n=1 Tax=Nannocystis pusilla TaxID=889268 RepID=UPI003DA42194
MVEVEDRGTVDAPDLRYAVSHGDVSPAAHPQLAAALRRVLGLDVDPAPLLQLTTADRRLRPTGQALRGMRPPRFAEWFEVFANVVPFQQVSLDAGAAVVARLVERFGRSIERAGRRFHAFPTAQAVAAARLDTLRACGLSARKAEVLRLLARAIASGELAEATIAGLATPDALATLGELPGIGPWSAALVLLRGLGRLDVFPPGDVGVARGLGALMRVAADAPLDVRALRRSARLPLLLRARGRPVGAGPHSRGAAAEARAGLRPLAGRGHCEDIPRPGVSAASRRSHRTCLEGQAPSASKRMISSSGRRPNTLTVTAERCTVLRSIHRSTSE